MADRAESIRSPAQLARFVITTARRFYDDQCLLHASALTYTTLLSLVPLLALMFAVLKGLGVQRRLEPLLLLHLGLDAEVTERVLTYIDRTSVGGLGALGAIALAVTVLTVLSGIEDSFNHIWRVRRPRGWVRKLTDYASVVLLTPFLLLIAVTITSSLQEQALLRFLLRTEYVGGAILFVLKFAPLVINTAALGILYAIMPNRRPYWPALMVSAVITAGAWQVVQTAYVSLQIGVARYSAIYGALSQLPVTLVWLYLSWSVVLAGAELAAMIEFGAESTADGRPVSRWAIALHALARAADGFRGGGAGIEPRVLARELRLDTREVDGVLAHLCDGGWLAQVADSDSRYVLARDPSMIDLASLDALVDSARTPTGCDPRITAAIAAMTADRRDTLHQRSLADLLAE